MELIQRYAPYRSNYFFRLQIDTTIYDVFKFNYKIGTLDAEGKSYRFFEENSIYVGDFNELKAAAEELHKPFL